MQNLITFLNTFVEIVIVMNTKSQTINTFLIVIGAALLIYSLVHEQEEAYFQIAGLVVLMYGLYKSTQQWVSDNKSDASEDQPKSNKDHKEDVTVENHEEKS